MTEALFKLARIKLAKWLLPHGYHVARVRIVKRPPLLIDVPDCLLDDEPLPTLPVRP